MLTFIDFFLSIRKRFLNFDFENENSAIPEIF
jgi:hypothetical protein